MRNANGYGSVYKLSGNRRKPWIVRKTIGWDKKDINFDENINYDEKGLQDIASKKGKQLYETIGYYAKREDAILALAEYNKSPFSIEQSKITFSEVFKQWSEQKYKEVSKSSINSYNVSYGSCVPLYDVRFVDIRTKDLQDIINNNPRGHSTLKSIRSLFNQLFSYAMANDIVSKDYSDYVTLPKKKDESNRKIFTSKEIARLFKVVNEEDFNMVDTILIMIYTGMRIGELMTIKNVDVDIANRTIIGGIKTEAGKDRVIPISKKILSFVEARFNQGHEHLISRANGKPYKYDNYKREHWEPLMNKLSMEHNPHDCRHTFASLMDQVGANHKSIQKIIGHSSYATTADIYTHKDIEQLKQAIDLLE